MLILLLEIRGGQEERSSDTNYTPTPSTSSRKRKWPNIVGRTNKRGDGGSWKIQGTGKKEAEKGKTGKEKTEIKAVSIPDDPETLALLKAVDFPETELQNMKGIWRTALEALQDVFGVTIDAANHGGPIRHLMLFFGDPPGGVNKMITKVQDVRFTTMKLNKRADGPEATKNRFAFKELLASWSRPAIKTKPQCIDCWKQWIKYNEDGAQVEAMFATWAKYVLIQFQKNFDRANKGIDTSP